jgi:hypothetical protein
LRRRLETDLAGNRSMADQIEIAALTIKTWNNIRSNKTPGKIIAWKRTINEAFPEVI